MTKIVLGILILFSVHSWAQEDFKLIADLAAKAKDGDNSVLKDLYKQSLNKENKSLRKYLVRAVTLSMLKSSSKATQPYLKKVTAAFPDENLLYFLNEPPLLSECTACKSFGKKLKDCSQCKEGACRNCKGEGVIIYGNGKSRKENPCIACKESGHCKPCKGTGELVTKCLSCSTKGFRINKASFASESQRTMNVLLNKAYELDGDTSTVFDADLLKADEEYAKKFSEELKERDAKWLDLEKKRLAAVKKKASAKKGLNYITTVTEEVVENYEEGGSTTTLDLICTEVSNYLQAQEKKSKQKILEKVYGQFLSDVPTVHVVVADDFVNASLDYQQRAADGFFRFAVLRAQRNGYDDIDFKVLNSKGNQIGGITDSGFKIIKN